MIPLRQVKRIGLNCDRDTPVEYNLYTIERLQWSRGSRMHKEVQGHRLRLSLKAAMHSSTSLTIASANIRRGRCIKKMDSVRGWLLLEAAAPNFGASGRSRYTIYNCMSDKPYLHEV
jgi:hypothetical protein